MNASVQFDDATLARLFGCRAAFDHPVTVAAVATIAALLVATPLVAAALHRSGVIGDDVARDVHARWRAWLILCLAILAPVLAGGFWTIVAVAALGMVCFHEFARATGLLGERAIVATVLAGIALLTFAVLDNFPRLFFATGAFTVGMIATVTLPQDRPAGYVRRTALGMMGFLLCGYCLAYVGWFANDANYRPILIWLLAATELNDIFAYCVGKAVGGPKLAPRTSPGKTRAGSIGALVLTTLVAAGLGHFVFRGTAVDHPGHLIALGLGIAVLGQAGDLLVSAIKRDVGVKDIGSVLPGMGGLLDRFDSLVLIPPVVFHYLSLVLGPIGSSQPERILTGG